MGEEEILSQREVEALLRGVGNGELETETDDVTGNISGVLQVISKHLFQVDAKIGPSQHYFN